MIDPTVVPDILPVTGLPWADATLKILGAVGVIGSFLATVLPRYLVITQLLAKGFADLRGVVPHAAEARGAVKEAAAQAVGLTTVAPSPVLPPVPTPPAAEMFRRE